MKRLFPIFLGAACLLAVPAVGRAQDCSNWSNWDLRGTYTMSGSGSIDLSKIVPGAGLPSGMVPMVWVGAHSYDGGGGGNGWVAINAGGTQINAQFAGLTYAMQPDCSVQVSFSMKLKELGVTIGPIARLLVIVPKPGALELNMILAGKPPAGAAAPGLDLGVSHRISMQP